MEKRTHYACMTVTQCLDNSRPHPYESFNQMKDVDRMDDVLRHVVFRHVFPAHFPVNVFDFFYNAEKYNIV